MTDKQKVFENFTKNFESEELSAYMLDLVSILPYSAWKNIQPALKAGQTINNMFSVEKLREQYPKPKQRDCIRIAVLLYNFDNNKDVIASWIKKNKVGHDIKQGLKDYIAKIIIEHEFIVELAASNTSSYTFSEQTLLTIQNILFPDPNTWFFGPEYKYRNMSFLLVLELDKDWLIKLKKKGNNPEPLKTYLEEYLL